MVSSITSFVEHVAGYRDAQCGWHTSGEDPFTETKHSKSRKDENEGHQIMQFLCIYAARRGIFEVSFFKPFCCIFLRLKIVYNLRQSP